MILYNKENNQLDATIGSLLKFQILARHISGNSYAHVQEHKTVEYGLWYEDALEDGHN